MVLNLASVVVLAAGSEPVVARRSDEVKMKTRHEKVYIW